MYCFSFCDSKKEEYEILSKEEKVTHKRKLQQKGKPTQLNSTFVDITFSSFIHIFFPQILTANQYNQYVRVCCSEFNCYQKAASTK